VQSRKILERLVAEESRPGESKGEASGTRVQA